MNIQGMPEQLWVVLKPFSVVELSDICLPCTFGGLMERVRGGLHQDAIAGIYADEDEAKKAAMQLLGKYPVRCQDALVAEIVVHVMVQPKVDGLTAGQLGDAAVEAVKNAIRLAENRGHQYRLADQAELGMSEVVEMKSLIIVNG